MIWEYEQVTRGADSPCTIVQLNAFGAEGWELVSVIATMAGRTFWWFKRPVPAESDPGVSRMTRQALLPPDELLPTSTEAGS